MGNSNFVSLLLRLGVVIFLCANYSTADVRKFTTVINPGCEQLYVNVTNCSELKNISLIHIRSDGNDDSYHFLWSFIGAPTLLMARTSLNTTLSVDWNEMLDPSIKSSISFNPNPFYSFGWSLVKVWMFNDTNDDVKLNLVDQQYVIGYRTKYFKWERLDNQSFANATDIRYTVIAKTFDHGDGKQLSLGPDGYFKFTIRMKSSTGYSDVLPYMLYSENGTQVDIAFNDVQLNTTEADYPTHPRIGFKYVLVQDEYLNSTSERMRMIKTKTLDDEHTPGVFETLSVRTPLQNGRDQSYIEWKPICYTGEVRDVIDSVDVVSYSLQNASSIDVGDNIGDSILYSYYGSDIDNFILEAMNISFGTQQDGFYNKTKHISWTYSTGFGEPPEDYVSLLVMLVVGIGLGIPTLIIILSIAYVLVKKLKQPRDDMLLGR